MGGVDHPVDQVVRREEFELRHPGVLITSPSQNGTVTSSPRWHAAWKPAGGGDAERISWTELRDLLNELERRFDRDGERAVP